MVALKVACADNEFWLKNLSTWNNHLYNLNLVRKHIRFYWNEMNEGTYTKSIVINLGYGISKYPFKYIGKYTFKLANIHSNTFHIKQI